MKKFKLMMVSSLLMLAGITTFEAKTNNKKLEKNQLYLLEQQRKNV